MNASVIIGAKVMTEAFSRIVGKSVFYNLELVTSQMAQWFSVFSSASTYAVLNSGIREYITAAICMSALLQHT